MLKEQLAWEQECIERGTARYYANQDRLRTQGQSESTDVVSYLLRDRLEDIAQSIQSYAETAKPGSGNKYHKILRHCAIDGDYMRIAYIGVQCAFQLLVLKDKNTILKLCNTIAVRLEADLKCHIFESKHPGYYSKVMKSFDEQHVRDYVHKHKVMMLKFNEFELEWTPWDAVQKVHTGAKVLQAMLDNFGDVFLIKMHWERGKKISKLDTTGEFDTWAAEFEKERGFYFPMMLPLKVAPLAWDGDNDKAGGYYTNKISRQLPLIKTRGKAHKAFVATGDPRAHRNALNKIQRTAWSINQRVLDVQAEIYQGGLGIGMPSNIQIKPSPFPAHLADIDKEFLTDANKEEIGAWKTLAKAAYGKELQRKGKVIAFMQSFKLAQELKGWERFFFAYNCDFRGRIYCATAGLSPQGADTARGILHFHKGVELGSDGAYWLAIQGANTYGYDKASYEGRVAWVKEHEELIRAVANDPVATRDLWGQADKPYQFLSFCFEWADSNCGRNPYFKSRIPVALDGSCNGLQHYSALLRDEVGARATNLVHSTTPADIYGQVADVCTETLWEISNSADDHAVLADIWLKVGVTRKCAKRPVMTLPYGSTQMSARLYVLEYAQDNWAKFGLPVERQWDMVKFLTPILWRSIGQVVVKARLAMTWLQANVGQDFCQWYTPLNFPVYQYYKDTKIIRVKTQLNGTLTLAVHNIDSDEDAKVNLQKNGIAPNFIHSIDSTHLVMTVNMTDFNSYAMVHDDYGTHAGHTGILFKKIREAMYNLYREGDVLESWAIQVGADTLSMPDKGSYEIKDILNAPYFFG